MSDRPAIERTDNRSISTGLNTLTAFGVDRNAYNGVYDIPTLLPQTGPAINQIQRYPADSGPAVVFQNFADTAVHIKTTDSYLSGNRVVTTDGSGSFVNPDGTVLTALHVIQNARYGITVQTSDGKSYQARVIGQDPAHDLAALQVMPRYYGQQFPYLDVDATGRLSTNETGDSIGFPLNTNIAHLSPGVYQGTTTLDRFNLQGSSKIVGEDQHRQVLTMAQQVDQGDSGAGVINERTGKLMGVVDMTTVDSSGRPNGTTVAIPGNQAAAFLNGLGKLPQQMSPQYAFNANPNARTQDVPSYYGNGSNSQNYFGAPQTFNSTAAGYYQGMAPQAVTNQYWVNHVSQPVERPTPYFGTTQTYGSSQNYSYVDGQPAGAAPVHTMFDLSAITGTQ
jgi:S1-C subfamily serine protease